MDYKYIEQLMERYWNGDTSLQEEEILRAFFAADDVPENLLPYKALFGFAEQDKAENVLDDKFDEKILSLINEEEPVKARVITMRQRLAPLFKAAAVVAIFITLGNAIQGAFESNGTSTQPAGMANTPKLKEGKSMAQADSVSIDSLQHKLSTSSPSITR